MKELILVIEDERSIADTILYALEREGFSSLWCATAEAGLAALTEKNPVLLIMDIGLPDQNGLDLCREIRRFSTVPIIFLSARSEELDRILGLELGGDDYVTKPFSPRELVARVRSVLRRHHTSSSERAKSKKQESKHVIVGDFSEDTEQLRIRFQGQNLDLSLYEYRLLSLLLSRPRKVFSREEILNRAWDEPEMTTDRTVDAHIKSIRKKIKEVDAGQDPIRTVRGVGYAMEWKG